jgi:hypothetical protein
MFNLPRHDSPLISCTMPYPKVIPSAKDISTSSVALEQNCGASGPQVLRLGSLASGISLRVDWGSLWFSPHCCRMMNRQHREEYTGYKRSREGVWRMGVGATIWGMVWNIRNLKKCEPPTLYNNCVCSRTITIYNLSRLLSVPSSAAPWIDAQPDSTLPNWLKTRQSNNKSPYMEPIGQSTRCPPPLSNLKQDLAASPSAIV